MSGWGTSFFRIVLGLLLARILGPEILGFYAFVFSVSELIGILGGFSLGLALIQATRTSQVHEDTAFAMAGVLGLVGIAVTLAVMPLVSAERTALAGTLLLALAFGRVLTLLGNVVLARMERSLQYRSVAITNTTAGVLPGIVALGLAASGFGAWALLAQDLLLGVLVFVLATALSGYRFRGALDRGVASELFAFAQGIFASRAIEIGLQRIDRLLIGGFLGDARLGLYHQGRVLAETGLVVERPLERISLNLFSRLRERPEALARAFALTQFFLVRLMFAGAAVLLVAPTATVALLLGEEWLAAAPLISAMALHAALAPVLSNARQLLYGRGRVGGAVLVRGIQLGTFLPWLGAAIVFGDVTLAAFGLTASTGIALALTAWMNREVTGPALRRDFAAPVLALAATLALHASPLGSHLATLPSALLPFLPVPVYAVVLWALERHPIARNLRALRDVLARRDV
jgi:PST family polysaccharide transporter